MNPHPEQAAKPPQLQRQPCAIARISERHGGVAGGTDGRGGYVASERPGVSGSAVHVIDTELSRVLRNAPWHVAHDTLG